MREAEGAGMPGLTLVGRGGDGKGVAADDVAEAFRDEGRKRGGPLESCLACSGGWLWRCGEDRSGFCDWPCAGLVDWRRGGLGRWLALAMALSSSSSCHAMRSGTPP
jgi:hypothetical protein